MGAEGEVGGRGRVHEVRGGKEGGLAGFDPWGRVRPEPEAWELFAGEVWMPARLPWPWDFPGKSTGVGCHFLLQCIKKQRHHFANKGPSSQSYGFSKQLLQYDLI